MTECKTKVKPVETVAGWEMLASAGQIDRYGAYIGMDVH